MCESPVVLPSCQTRNILASILWKNYSKFESKHFSLKKSVTILIFKLQYMEMCFHGNQPLLAIQHHFINLNSKYQSFRFIFLPFIHAPVFPSLDDIYCGNRVTERAKIVIVPLADDPTSLTCENSVMRNPSVMLVVFMLVMKLC